MSQLINIALFGIIKQLLYYFLSGSLITQARDKIIFFKHYVMHLSLKTQKQMKGT